MICSLRKSIYSFVSRTNLSQIIWDPNNPMRIFWSYKNFHENSHAKMGRWQGHIIFLSETKFFGNCLRWKTCCEKSIRIWMHCYLQWLYAITKLIFLCQLWLRLRWKILGRRVIKWWQSASEILTEKVK